MDIDIITIVWPSLDFKYVARRSDKTNALN